MVRDICDASTKSDINDAKAVNSKIYFLLMSFDSYRNSKVVYKDSLLCFLCHSFESS